MNPDSPLTTEQVWNELGQALRGFFARRLADSHAVDDLVQEVFLRVHRGLDSLADDDRVGPWVFRIARNVLTDHFRKQGARRESGLESVEPAAPVTDDTDTDERIGRCLRSMLSRLPKDYREAVEAVEIGGQTQVAFAASAGLSVPGAKSRVQRGRQKLKDALLACCRFEFDRWGKPVALVGEERCATGCGCAGEGLR